MYRRKLQNQMEFESFYLPFSGQLNPANRWVILAGKIDWAMVAELYARNFSNPQLGSPAKEARIAFGSLIIQEYLRLTDRELIEQISENPYLQYFLGLHEYQPCPFTDSSLVNFRKRFTKEDFDLINATIVSNASQQQAQVVNNEEDNDGNANSNNKNDKNDGKDENDKPNAGKLIVDATCCPSDISYPTDLGLLNDAREKSQQIIDIMHAPSIGQSPKPRTYRQKARKDYLAVAKQKQPGAKKIRKAIGKQLAYLRRNLQSIEEMADKGLLVLLDNILYRKLLVINELYRQQRYMYANKVHSVNDRIVSISQPHIRPIVRGKARHKTEFGAKVSISLVDGFCYLDTISWDSYNESQELIMQIEAYKNRTGVYPESVHADKIYRNADNRKYCQKNGIRLSGKPLGRPSQNKDKLKADRQQQYQDEIARIPVEGKFGQGKRRFGLKLIMTKLAATSASAICLGFIVMNLEKILRDISFFYYYLLALLSARTAKAALSSRTRNYNPCITPTHLQIFNGYRSCL